MAITLTAAVGVADSSFPVSAAPAFRARPFLAQIDAEQVLVDAAGATEWSPVHRGQNGTSPATHAQGATISPLYGVQSTAAGAAVATIPTASSSVSGPPAFGASASAGSSTSFSKGDHVHGLPIVPHQLLNVVHASPVGGGYVAQFMFDDTATTGGLYAWTGTDYAKVGLATS